MLQICQSVAKWGNRWMLLPGLELLRKARCLSLLANGPCWLCLRLSSASVGQRCCIRPWETMHALFRVRQGVHTYMDLTRCSEIDVGGDRPNFSSDIMYGKARRHFMRSTRLSDAHRSPRLERILTPRRTEKSALQSAVNIHILHLADVLLPRAGISATLTHV